LWLDDVLTSMEGGTARFLFYLLRTRIAMESLAWSFDYVTVPGVIKSVK
jgi:hypothetical protein